MTYDSMSILLTIIHIYNTSETYAQFVFLEGGIFVFTIILWNLTMLTGFFYNNYTIIYFNINTS